MIAISEYKDKAEHLVKDLLKCGASAKAVDALGNSVLHWIVRENAV